MPHGAETTKADVVDILEFLESAHGMHAAVRDLRSYIERLESQVPAPAPVEVLNPNKGPWHGRTRSPL